MMIDRTLDFIDKVAVITGRSGAPCSAIAQALGECGANVILVARTQESLDKVAADIRGKGGRTIGIRLLCWISSPWNHSRSALWRNSGGLPFSLMEQVVHISQEYSSPMRVNAIAPGFLLTAQNRFPLINEQTGELNERGKKIRADTPMDVLAGLRTWSV